MAIMALVTSPESWSARFSLTARSIARAARALGLEVPGFRAPPTRPGVDRSMRRWPDGRCVVAVRVAGRPFGAVVDDLVAGVLAVNELTGDRASSVRDELLRVIPDEERAA